MIGAIFVITMLAMLGALVTRMVNMGNTESISEWLSAQALYSAESGIDWAAYDILHGGNGVTINAPVITNRSWVNTMVPAPLNIGGHALYSITSQGKTGTNVTAPLVQRQIEVEFIP